MFNVNNADVYTDFNGLAKLKNEARKNSPQALKEAAKQFESIFLHSVLKGMRETKLADGVMDNDQSKFYNDMYDQQLAVHLSGSVGLADLIVKQMKHDEHETPTNEKQGLDDYLNKLSTASKVMPGNHSVADHKAYSKFEDVVNEIDEISLKNDSSLPIQSTQDFVKRLYPFAEQAAKELGVEPKVLLAQAALESNWGRSLIKNSDGHSSFNLFNIKADKAWQGRQAHVKTLEFDQGTVKKVNSAFRTYASFQESFQDYVAFIKSNPRYQEALKQVDNAERYVHELQRAGYATDPHYASKVISIYRGNRMAGFEPETVVAMK